MKFLLLCMIGMVLGTGYSRAACTSFADMVFSPVSLSYTGPSDSVTPGQVIRSSSGGSGWAVMAPNQWVFFSNCNAATSWAQPAFAPVPGVTYSDGSRTFPVYPLPGYPGVGFVIGVKDTNASNYIPVGPGVTQTYPAPGTPTTIQQALGWMGELLFVAYDRLRPGSGVLPSNVVLATFTAKNSSGSVVGTARLIMSGGTIAVSSLSCTVPDADQLVPLPAVRLQDFTGVGSSPPVSKGFQLSLSCPAGVNKVMATMTDVQNPSNTSNILTADRSASGSANGVGLQLTSGSNVISFGPDSSATGTTNQWTAWGSVPGTGGSYVVPLTVKYVQTQSTIVPGTIKALATVTFSYQ